jgi:hypothetical protein
MTRDFSDYYKLQGRLGARTVGKSSRELHMAAAVPAVVTLRGFFTSQKWLRGKTLDEMEALLGYRTGRLSTAGAAVYAFTRLPENWEFEVAGYTNVSGGMSISSDWVEADRKAAPYYAKTGMRSSETVLKDNARASMTIYGENRLIKVKPLLDDLLDTYPPGRGIPQWRVSKEAAEKGTLQGDLLRVIQPGQNYPG